MRMTPLLPLILAAGLAVQGHARPLTPADVMSLSRIADATVSQDGRWLAWDQQGVDAETNAISSDLWRLDLGRPDAKPEKISSPEAASKSAPAFGPGGWLYFLSRRDGGRNVVARISMNGGPPSAVTDPFDLSGFKVSPKGDALMVWADRPVGARSLDDAAPAREATGSGRVYDKLFVRHWNRWDDGRRSQLFVIPLRDGRAPGGGRAVSAGLVGDSPPRPRGGGEAVAWSADGLSVFFTLREAGRIEPLSTNMDVFSSPADGASQPTDLTATNKATDSDPTASPDGRWLAWLATTRPGFENDRQVVWLRELATGRTHALTGSWDRSVDSIRWSADSRTILATAADTMDHPVFAIDVTTGSVHRRTGAGKASGVVPLLDGGFIFKLDSLTAPPDFWRSAPNGRMTRLTAINAKRLVGIDWPSVTRFSFAGAEGDRVWGLSLRPGALPPNERAPVAFLVHGGPQSTFADTWTYNWNMAAWAGRGYAVVSIDFHGSVGYGQTFTDTVQNDWGGKPLTDLKLGLAAAIDRFDYLDGSRVCAAGGSYGGFMMNWIESNWPDRFKCLVQHDGVFDQRAMSYETDELAPDQWDFGNRPYYETPAAYEKWNPVNGVADWRTPQLVITGESDFRSPYTEAIAAFTALQMRSVPSRLLVFPDEGHVVAKPRNNLQWYEEVFSWMDRWTKGPEGTHDGKPTPRH